jgi:hypothetical protein
VFSFVFTERLRAVRLAMRRISFFDDFKLAIAKPGVLPRRNLPYVNEFFRSGEKFLAWRDQRRFSDEFWNAPRNN